MAHRIDVLDIAPELQAALRAHGLADVHGLRDASLERLAACGLTQDQCQRVLAAYDAWIIDRFQGQVLFPMLPEPLHYVECAYLDLPAHLLVSLEVHRVQYLYELAFSRRHRLSGLYGADAVNDFEGALKRFLDSYRQDEIVLHLEETEHD